MVDKRAILVRATFKPAALAVSVCLTIFFGNIATLQQLSQNMRKEIEAIKEKAPERTLVKQLRTKVQQRRLSSSVALSATVHRR